jgi:large subunit ribosomal protein L7e
LAARTAARAAAKKERAEKRKTQAANAEKYAKEYAAADKAIVDAKRNAKKTGSFFVEAQSKIAFVIRIRGINKLSPK